MTFAIGILILLFMCCLLLCCKDNFKNTAFLAADDQRYVFSVLPEGMSIRIGGVAVESAPLERILGILNISPPDTLPCECISGPKQAAQQGVSVLNEVFEMWTYDNQVGVTFNRNAGVWIVHGLVEDRTCDDSVGIVAFDGATGKVLGVGFCKPSN